MRLLLALTLFLPFAGCAEIQQAAADAVPGVLPAATGGPTGAWDTTYGDMTFNGLRNGRVTATYTGEDGRLDGTMQGSVYSGLWAEPSSGRTCTSVRNGSDHWGQFRFTFNATLTRFEGVWGYCGDDPTRNWTGTRS